MIKNLKIFCLKALLACDGLPMPESSLIGAMQIGVRPHGATRGDCEQAIKELEGSGLVAGVSNEFTGVTWTLTDKGTHEARKL